MKESYLADLADAEKALFAVISNHSDEMPPMTLSCLRAAFRGIIVEEEAAAARIRIEWRKTA